MNECLRLVGHHRDRLVVAADDWVESAAQLRREFANRLQRLLRNRLEERRIVPSQHVAVLPELRVL